MTDIGVLSSLDKASAVPEGADAPQMTISFFAIPDSLSAFTALPQAALKTPFDAAALTLLALCVYTSDPQTGVEMLNWLRGPRPLNTMELSVLRDCFRSGKTYLPFSYFAGATPKNHYTPTHPFTLTVFRGQTPDAEPGYEKLFLRSGGADTPRPIRLRRRKDGTWLLWEQYLLTDIRRPETEPPN